jgi:hypothetical protein
VKRTSPRAGGEAAKFGARFEELWTVKHLLDVLLGTHTNYRPASEPPPTRGASSPRRGRVMWTRSLSDKTTSSGSTRGLRRCHLGSPRVISSPQDSP